jgi:hypothetical protein
VSYKGHGFEYPTSGELPRKLLSGLDKVNGAIADLRKQMAAVETGILDSYSEDQKRAAQRQFLEEELRNAKNRGQL